MKTKTLLAILILTCTHAWANDPLEVGKPCPDVKFTDVQYYNKKEVSVSDFRGKWFALDFFTQGCVACFESFPKMNELREEFKDRMEIMLVGWGNEATRKIYERFKAKQQITLPVAYDTTWFKAFKIRAVPYIIVVDPNGIVRAITTKLNRQNVEDLLAGKEPRLFVARNADQLQERTSRYDSNEPLLINNNGGFDTEFIFRSVLAPWDGVISAPQGYHIHYRMKNMVQVVGLPIAALYLIAYGDTTEYVSYIKHSPYGKWWWFPVVESKNPELELNWGYPENKYNYSLIVPPHKASTQYLKEAMQRDLKNYFGYDVTIEHRLMPCWKVIATEKAKTNLKTKGGEARIVDSLRRGNVIIENEPVSQLINRLATWFQPGATPPYIFIDETGIKGNIDLNLDVLQTDFEDWQRALMSVGLNLVKSKKEMKVIVMRDPA